jgi:2-polyprenyl-6-methoxyphenol hydroxylase-like FAD-dependent oxidoreductase
MTKFKAIIVGGGPVGLIMAHALSKANIDFVLVEKRDTISTWTGAALSMWGHGMRILHQLGLEDVLLPAYAPVRSFETVGTRGETIGSYPQTDALYALTLPFR